MTDRVPFGHTDLLVTRLCQGTAFRHLPRADSPEGLAVLHHCLDQGINFFDSAQAYGWGGAGGSIIWMNPVEQIGFGYAITGFVGGFNGDQNRASSILRGLHQTPAMEGATGAATMSAAMKGVAQPARL